MSRRKPTSAAGATQEPDLAEDELGTWTAEPLDAGFEIEEARLSGGDLSGTDASAGRIVRCRLDGVGMAGARLRSLQLRDVAAVELDLSNVDLTGARITRTRFEGCRMTGLLGAELEADDVLFRDCKLDLASFRASRLRNVTFADCVLDEAEFSGCTLEASRFEGSQLPRTNFEGARLARVDFRGSELKPLAGLLSLRGAIIDSAQLIDLAAPLAREVGLLVEEPE
jgi:uncharacterized protein YjbI with pentapeptide repeats